MATLTPDGPGFRPKDNKYQPAKLGDRSREGQADANKVGTSMKFNDKAKVAGGGSDYHELSPTSGLDGNFDTKDKSIEYLRQRGKEGMTVHHFSGGTEVSRVSTHDNGGSVYPSRPIAEVYKPATGQNFGMIKHPTDAVGEPSNDPIMRPIKRKSEEA